MKADLKLSVAGIVASGALFIALVVSAAMVLKVIPVRNYTVATVVLVAIGAAIAAIMELRRPAYDFRRGRRAAIVVLVCCVGGYVLFGCLWIYFALKYGW
jgi:hypothetical protein